MERVAGIQTGGSERAFDLYMKARYLHEQHPGHGVTFATGTPISNTMVEMYTMQRFLDPEGLRSRGIEHFDAWAATFGEVSTRWKSPRTAPACGPAAASPGSPTCPNSSRCSAPLPTCRRPRCSNLPRPRLEGGKPIVVACPMSEEQRALQQELVARYDRLRIAEGRSPGGQRARHHHRRPQARPRCPDALRHGTGLPRLEGQRPGRERRRHLAAHRRDTRHADDLLRHGRQPDAVGLLGLRRDHRQAGRARHPPRADRRDRRCRHRRQEAGPLREGPQRLRSGCCSAARRRWAPAPTSRNASWRCITSTPPGSPPRSSSATAASSARATRTRKSRSTATSPKGPSTPICGRPWRPRPGSSPRS